MEAPICVAKGVDAVALKIREVAGEHAIPIVENPPLARALHATVEIDQEIPAGALQGGGRGDRLRHAAAPGGWRGSRRRAALVKGRDCAGPALAPVGLAKAFSESWQRDDHPQRIDAGAARHAARHAGPARRFDKSQSAPRPARIGLVLLVALALVGAAVGLMLTSAAPRRHLYPGAAGRARHCRRVRAVRARRRHPALCRPGAGQSAAQGGGRQRLRRHPGHRPVGPRDLCQCRLSRPDRGGRPQRRAADRAGVHRRSRTSRRRSTACSRPRARAAACRRRCASRRCTARPRAGCACACARSARASATARMTVWSIADVTRDRERQENVFQELQHAIDYLDHAPAGFFSVDADGRHRLSQRHARRLARPRSRPGRLRRR